MPQVADLFHYWGYDLQQGATGGIALARRSDRTTQRIIRRLLTNPGGGEYPWDATYGAGLPELIGQPLDIRNITTRIIGQIALEPSVARSPSPQVSVQVLNSPEGGVGVSVVWFDLAGNPNPLSFNLTAAPPPSPYPVQSLEAVTPPSPFQLPPMQPDPNITIVPSNPVPIAQGF